MDTSQKGCPEKRKTMEKASALCIVFLWCNKTTIRSLKKRRLLLRHTLIQIFNNSVSYFNCFLVKIRNGSTIRIEDNGITMLFTEFFQLSLNEL